MSERLLGLQTTPTHSTPTGGGGKTLGKVKGGVTNAGPDLGGGGGGFRGGVTF